MSDNKNKTTDEKKVEAGPENFSDAKERAEGAGVSPKEFDRQARAHELDAKAQDLAAEANAKTSDEQADTLRESRLLQNQAERVSKGFDEMDTRSDRRKKLIDANLNGQLNCEQSAEKFDLNTETVTAIIEEDQAKRSLDVR